jgi:hypothetical protein
MEGEGGLSEQKIIENYLAEYRLEDAIDEIINSVVLTRPANPYTAIATAFEAKTMPEILEVQLVSQWYYGIYCVKSSVITNAGTFHGIATYSVDPSLGNVEPKDYLVLDGKLTEMLSPINPINFKQVEDAILTIPDLDPAESLSLSIAALRTMAKFKNCKLYEMIASLAGTKDDQICIPLPVTTIGMMNVPTSKAIKSIQLFPVRSTSFQDAITAINQLFNKIIYHEKTARPMKFSPLGTPWIDCPTIEDLTKVIRYFGYRLVTLICSYSMYFFYFFYSL